MAFFLTRGITVPLAKIVAAARGLAQGDITQNIQISRSDEIGDLADSFKELIVAQQNKADVASQIAQGNLDKEIQVLSDDDMLGFAMTEMKENILSVLADTEEMVRASVDGRLEVRADEQRHHGDWKRIIRGLNQSVSALVGHIDAMPAPAMIIDSEYNVRYMNKTAAGLLGKSQAQLIGTKCYNNFKTEDCNTENCACRKAMSTRAAAASETVARPDTGATYEIAYSGIPLRDEKQNIIGAFEVISDQTAVKQAARVAGKQAAYQGTEVERLVTNLKAVAQGKLTLDTNIEQFMMIQR